MAQRWLWAVPAGAACAALSIVAAGPGASVVGTDRPAAALQFAADKPAPKVDAEAKANKANKTNKATLSFNRDIRPILSDKCFACHGPDASVAKDSGGFRLDKFEHATKPAKASGKVPIVPGDAGASEIIKRIHSDKPNITMPPPRAKITLTEKEKALLAQWIDEGAKYEGHWAYQTPTKPALPQVSQANAKWVKNSIDRFIAARLEKAGLSPSKEADRATLIRRVYLDVIGLPPTPKEIDAFISDKDPKAYEKLVDRLLANQHFGERLAIVWLDAARFADTIGYQLDHKRNSWPYRDWVIEAFNTNKPYNEFVVEQLAGDMLPGASDAQKLATAFSRMHMMNHEGGSIDEEFRVEQVSDRIETIATVFMAQTYNCAKCHDHKYDPTAQQDYYNLFKYFHSIDERGVWSNKPERAAAYGPRLDWYTPQQKAALAKARAGVKQAEQARRDAASLVIKHQSNWEKALRSKHGVRWAKAPLKSAKSSQLNATIKRMPDGSVLLANRDSPGAEDLTLVYRTSATGLRLIKLDALTDPWNNGHLGRGYVGDAQPTHLTLRATSVKDPTKHQDVKLRWAWASKSEQGRDRDALNILKKGRPGWGTGTPKDKLPRTLLLVADEPFGFEGGTELRMFIEQRSGLSRRTLGRLRLAFAAADKSVLEAFPVVMRDWYQAGPYTAKSYKQAYDKAFGPEQEDKPLQDGAKVGGKKWQARPDLTPGKDARPRGRNSATYYARTILSSVKRKVSFSPGDTYGGVRVFLNGQEIKNKDQGAARLYVLDLELNAGENRLVVKVINGKKPNRFVPHLMQTTGDPVGLTPLALIEPDGRTAHGSRAFSEDWRSANSPIYAKLTQAVLKAEQALRKIQSQATPVSVMRESDKPKPMHVLFRGDYRKRLKDRPAKLELPSFIDLPLPEGAPNNRLGFAKWLTRPDHPLTARVHVNRLWQTIFGVGIVATVEDFGNQAEWPSHPALLDYLAVSFVESGWDQKALIKQIVMSAAYRQQSRRQLAADEVDPKNRLLSYFPRRRMPGELIRDHALAVSGLLNETIGGPSVKPYQPQGLWREVSMGPRSNTNIFKRDNGDKLYRRSLYTFIKRKAPPPQLAIFGAPNRESCVVQRDMTNTPLQVLTLWNDEQFLEAARVLAQHTLAKTNDDASGLKQIFRKCTGRSPGKRELAVLGEVLGYYRKRYNEAPKDAAELLKQGIAPLPAKYDPAELAAWMMVGNTVLSLDETIVRD